MKDKIVIEEIWKDIKDYNGLYQISNYGRVKSLPKYVIKNEKILKNKYDKDGYCEVCLCNKDKKRNYFRVHRLVAQEFISNFYKKPQVNHINGIKNDNRVENLEWVTASENQIHSIKVLKNNINCLFTSTNNPMKNKFGIDNYKSKRINQYDLKNNLIKTWGSMSDIKRELNYNISCICECCKGIQKTSKGFIWGYNND